MSAAKNKKRAKGKTVTLSDFLHNEKDNTPGFTVCHVDWADAMENEELDDKYTLDVKKVVLPTAPKSARGPDVDLNMVPTKPPFTAYVGNLSYDATEEDIEKFFRKIKLDVSSVRIPREGGGRVRGFGYAEFPDRKSLIEALSLHNETLKNRSVKVSLATEHGGEGGERKDDRSDRTAGDWRSSSKDDSMGGRNDRSRNGPYSDNEPYRGRSSNEYGSSREDRGGDRDFDRERRFGDRDRGFGGDRDRGFGGDRDRGFGGDRDRGFGGDRDRGFGGDPDRGFGGDRERSFGGDWDRSHGGDRDRGFGERAGFDRREQSRDFGGSRYDDYQRKDDFHRRGADDFPRRGGDDFSRRGGEDFPRRGGSDYRRGDDGPRDRGGYDRTDSARDGPKERPKLQLKPRTVPVDSGGADSAPSKIFGGAKPVDTAAREREIEEKLAKEHTDGSKTERNRDDDRIRRTAGGGIGPSRSRQTLESRNNYRNSLSEDDSAPVCKSPDSRQRHSSLNSTGSEKDNVHEDNQQRKDTDSGNQSRSNGSLQRKSESQSGAHRMGPPHPPQVEEEQIVYTSANKFSHLLNDEEDLDGSVSD